MLKFNIGSKKLLILLNLITEKFSWLKKYRKIIINMHDLFPFYILLNNILLKKDFFLLEQK